MNVCCKLKDTEFAVAEHVSLAVCEACQKLIEYVTFQGKSFKLPFNKTVVGSQTFSFDMTHSHITKDRTLGIMLSLPISKVCNWHHALSFLQIL